MPLVELIFALFAILAVATPFITLALLGKHKKLRERVDQLVEENSRQHAWFQKEVADLKRQLASAVHPVAPAVGEAGQRTVAPDAPPVKETPVPGLRVELPKPVLTPAPVSFPTPDKKLESAPQKPQETPPLLPSPISAAPPSAPMQKPTAPVAPKPVLPDAAKTPVEVKPSGPGCSRAGYAAHFCAGATHRQWRLLPPPRG